MLEQSHSVQPGALYGSTQLTPKEREIVELVASGLKNKEVAVQVGMSEHVVKNYLRGIYDKLGLWNRTELALWFLKNGEQVVEHKLGGSL